MKHTLIYFTLAAALTFMAAACGTSRDASDTSAKESAATSVQAGTAVYTPDVIASWVPTATVPNARIYRTNGNYADNVPVNCAADGSILSYPAPSDLTDATPIALEGGWLLDRRGIGLNSRFTKYTYSEYSRLSAAPSPKELRKAIISGARVTEVVEMPFPYSPGCAAACDSVIAARGLR